MKKISVIIPVYNMEKYLDKCVSSVLKQTYKNLEIILVDDGSKDSSPALCDEYAKKDERIKVIHKVNGGLSEARNFAIDIATGDYIGFVDSDDYVAEDMFESLYNLCEQYNADISIESFYEIRKDKIVSCANSGKLQLLTREEAQIELLRDTNIQSYAWNKLYKRELFETGIRYPVGKTFEDIATTYLLFEKSNKIVRQEKPIYYYVRRDDSLTEARNYSNYKSYIEINMEKYLYLFEKYAGNKRVQDFNSYNFIINMIWLYSLIVTYNLEELEKDFNKIYPFFMSLVEKSKEIIDEEMNIFNKTILNMIMIDKNSTKSAIKELYMSERLKREKGESNLQI